MAGSIRQKIKSLQRKDEKTKKRLSIVLSILAMLVVLGAWLAYLNLTSPLKAEKAGIAKAEEQKKQSIFRTMILGMKIIGRDIKAQVEKTKEDLKEAKNFAENILRQGTEIRIDKNATSTP